MQLSWRTILNTVLSVALLKVNGLSAWIPVPIVSLLSERSKTLNLVIVANVVGMVLESKLALKLTLTNEVALEICHGIVPRIWLLLMKSVFNFFAFAIVDGKVPVRALEPMSRYCKLVKSNRFEGIWPSKKLLPRYITVNADNDPIAVGMVPCRRLLDTSRKFRFVKQDRLPLAGKMGRVCDIV